MKDIRFQQGQDIFWQTLKARVNRYFTETGQSRHTNTKMNIKIAIMLISFIAPYVLLMIIPFESPLALIGCVIMGLAMAGIGFNISHQAAHYGVSRKKSVNRLLSLSFNLLGMSDYIWKIKHNVFHHTYTNVYENDEALKEGDLLRLSHEAPLKRHHRFQHIYVLPIYAFFTIFWVFVLDYEKLMRYNGNGNQKYQRHPLGEVILFHATKIYYVLAAFILPHYVAGYSWGAIVCGFLIVHVIASLLITFVLQVEHISEDIIFVRANENGIVQKSWAQNQLEGTCNFNTGNRLLEWYIGGCNYQIEHHLFPTICSIHYPALSKIVAETAAEFNLQYLRHNSFSKAIVSHFRTLKAFGNPLQPSIA